MFVREVSINVSERRVVESANCFPVLTRSEVFFNRMTNYVQLVEPKCGLNIIESRLFLLSILD